MPARTHLRIVCLKNPQRLPQHHHSGLIVAGSHDDILPSAPAPPSLAYLSARMQLCSGPERHSGLTQNHAMASQRTLEMTETQTLRVGELPSVSHYFEGQRRRQEEKKATICSLMGAIEFGGERKREKRVARSIRQTIGGSSLPQRVGKRRLKVQEEIRRNSSIENRPALAQDFENFLAKQQSPQPVPQAPDEEQIRLKRLAVVNPEDSPEQPLSSSRLDLFRFQPDRQVKKQAREGKEGRGPSSQEEGVRARVQRRLLCLGLSTGGENDQFSWSRVPARSDFAFGCGVD